jgi:hypothetical protein
MAGPALARGASTWVVPWADGTPRPPISMLNALAGQVISNSAVVPVGANGRIDVFNGAGRRPVRVRTAGPTLRTHHVIGGFPRARVRRSRTSRVEGLCGLPRRP